MKKLVCLSAAFLFACGDGAISETDELQSSSRSIESSSPSANAPNTTSGSNTPQPPNGPVCTPTGQACRPLGSNTANATATNASWQVYRCDLDAVVIAVCYLYAAGSAADWYCCP